MSRRRVAAVVALLVVAAACGDATFAGSSDAPDASDSDASTDATTVDGRGPDSAAIDASGDEAGNVPGNLLLDPSFESNPAVGCGKYWTQGTNATIAISPIAHSGSASCMICVGPSPGVMGTNTLTEPLTNLDAGDYQSAMWVMPINGSTAPASAEQTPTVFEQFVDGGSREFFSNAFTPPTGSWTQIYFSVPLDPSLDMEVGIDVYAALDAGTGCLLIDDVSLVKQ